MNNNILSWHSSKNLKTLLFSVGGLQVHPEGSRRQARGGGLHSHLVWPLQTDWPIVCGEWMIVALQHLVELMKIGYKKEETGTKPKYI